MHGMALPPNNTLIPAKSVHTHNEWAPEYRYREYVKIRGRKGGKWRCRGGRWSCIRGRRPVASGRECLTDYYYYCWTLFICVINESAETQSPFISKWLASIFLSNLVLFLDRIIANFLTWFCDFFECNIRVGYFTVHTCGRGVCRVKKMCKGIVMVNVFVVIFMIVNDNYYNSN